MEMQQQGGRRMAEDHLCGLWTNEKHVNFLNWMEDSFVRTMLDHHRDNNSRNNNKKNNSSHTHQRLPLDRFLPDSSESTRDLRRHHHKITTSTTTTHRFSGVDADPNTATSAREEEKMTCLSLRPYDSSSSSNDQVVPQFGTMKGGGDDGDDKMAVVEEEEEKTEISIKLMYQQTITTAIESVRG